MPNRTKMVLASKRCTPRFASIEYRMTPSHSTDATHIVTVVDGAVVACTCQGFINRLTCRHITEAESEADRS